MFAQRFTFYKINDIFSRAAYNDYNNKKNVRKLSDFTKNAHKNFIFSEEHLDGCVEFFFSFEKTLSLLFSDGKRFVGKKNYISVF